VRGGNYVAGGGIGVGGVIARIGEINAYKILVGKHEGR
jgi:hypothetical protein